MNKIKVEKDELLNHLRSNYEAHKKDYAEACVEYRKQAVVEFKKLLESAESGGDFARGIEIPRPVNYNKEYEKIIAKLRWTTETIIELDEGEFDSYVMDNWSWKREFLINSSLYLKK